MKTVSSTLKNVAPLKHRLKALAAGEAEVSSTLLNVAPLKLEGHCGRFLGLEVSSTLKNVAPLIEVRHSFQTDYLNTTNPGWRLIPGPFIC